MTQKIQQTEADVDAFLRTIDDEEKRNDCFVLKDLMEKVSGEPAKMWGDSMVGFGRYHYTYASGHSGSYMLTGFSPRKQQLTVYIIPGFEPYQEHLAKLGSSKQTKSCLGFKRLKDIDIDVLEEIVADSVRRVREIYPS